MLSYLTEQELFAKYENDVAVMTMRSPDPNV